MMKLKYSICCGLDVHKEYFNFIIKYHHLNKKGNSNIDCHPATE